MWTIILLLVLAALGIWVGTGAVEGVMDAQKRPTEPMEFCNKHGAFRKKHVIQFEGATICPRCFQEAFTKVEN